MHADMMKHVITEEDYKLPCNQFKSEEMDVGLNFYVEMDTNDVSHLRIDVEGDFKNILIK